MAALTARMRLAEMVLGRPLTDYLGDKLGSRLSHRQIVRDLCDDTNGDVDITEVTLRAWLGRLDVTRVSA